MVVEDTAWTRNDCAAGPCSLQSTVIQVGALCEAGLNACEWRNRQEMLEGLWRCP